ncbi:MAG: FAD-dependent monooxygenase [Alphaproteobacteria bacterium]|nr:FAD-dependent monooxygenase [Alphaproteobacteria bacterium]
MSGASTQAIVVGGGLAGVAAAVAVAQAGLETVHLAPVGPPDRRTSALMMPSVDYLQSAELIGAPEELGHALSQIRIIDATHRLIRAPETLFDASDAGIAAFGWNFANAPLLECFHACAARYGNLAVQTVGATNVVRDGTDWVVTLGDGRTVRAPLLVGADGKKSLVRSAAGLRASERSFNQSALVCDLDLTRPIGSTSIEFHYPRGPFTLVPAGGNRANLVWIDDATVLAEAQAGGTEHLLAIFEERSQRLFGKMSLASPSHVFPLGVLSVDRAGADGVVLTGESAHAFPPIGAQGLNLGLRDVADLARSLAEVGSSRGDWAVAVSQDYAKRRAADLARTGGMVDTLFRSLLADMLPAQALRAGGLWALKLTPALRKQAFSLGMGIR